MSVAKEEPKPKRQRTDDSESIEVSNPGELKSARRKEILRRLTELGWKESDYISYTYGMNGWNSLVEQPIPLTEHIWADIKPHVIRMVEEACKAKRTSQRKSKLSEIMDKIKRDEPLLIDAETPRLVPRSASDSDTPDIQISHRRLFPLSVDMAELPIFKSFLETDVSVSGMEARFERHREEIEAYVLKWRVKIEGHLAELLREGRVADGLKRAAPAPKLPVEKSEPNPFRGVSDDLKLLLRADSLFEPQYGSHKGPVTYDTLLATRDSSFKSRSTYHSTYYYSYDLPQFLRPLELSKYSRHAKAQAVARALLAALKKPNACFIEMKRVGSRFKCGRCRSSSTRTWGNIIQHYLNEQEDWEKKFQEYVPEAQELGITLENVHALDFKSKKPLIKVFNLTQHASDPNPKAPSDFMCLLCRKIGLDLEEDTEDKVVVHINKLHGVAEPEWEVHYSIDGCSEQSDDGYDSSGHRCRDHDNGRWAYDSEDDC